MLYSFPNNTRLQGFNYVMLYLGIISDDISVSLAPPMCNVRKASQPLHCAGPALATAGTLKQALRVGGGSRAGEHVSHGPGEEPLLFG